MYRSSLAAWERIQDAQIKLAETERRIYLSKYIILMATVEPRIMRAVAKSRDYRSKRRPRYDDWD